MGLLSICISSNYLPLLIVSLCLPTGGVSIIDAMTDGKYSQNFEGCIEDLVIHGKGPLESRDAIKGYNVLACSPPRFGLRL